MTDNTPFRNTIFCVDAVITRKQAFEEDQYIFTLRAPEIAAGARAGQFVHVRCHDDLPIRRPFSILSADAAEGTVSVLFKVVGLGSRKLAACQSGTTLSLLGPIGSPFRIRKGKTAILLGGGVGIPPVFFLAQALYTQKEKALALLGSEAPFPFELTESRFALAGLAGQPGLSLAGLENLGIPARLCSIRQPGCIRGYVSEPLVTILESLSETQRREHEIYACGPEPMLKAVARVAADFRIPSQLCVEEFMACGVGGCAGCTIEVATENGPAMRRVCVDGPVFDGESLLPAWERAPASP